MTTLREWKINGIKIKITEELEHWLKKNFSSQIISGRIIKLGGTSVESILENILNHHTNTKGSSITLTIGNFHIFNEIIQKKLKMF